MTTKSELFRAVQADNKIILLCGEIKASTRLTLCNSNILRWYELSEDDGIEDIEDVKVSVHGGFSDLDIEDFEDYMEPWNFSFYQRKANLTLQDDWHFSLVCNAHTFSLNKLKRIIHQTDERVFLHCTRESLKDLYHSLKGFHVLPIDWANKTSFTEDLLANEFFGKLELSMSSRPKSENDISNFLSIKN